MVQSHGLHILCSRCSGEIQCVSPFTRERVTFYAAVNQGKFHQFAIYVAHTPIAVVMGFVNDKARLEEIEQIKENHAKEIEAVRNGAEAINGLEQELSRKQTSGLSDCWQ
eukprot:6076216-Amphidinium_carterae.1